jgi:hypothetical protein
VIRFLIIGSVIGPGILAVVQHRELRSSSEPLYQPQSGTYPDIQAERFNADMFIVLQFE